MLDAGQMARLFEAIVVEEERFGGSAFACAAIRLAFWTGWRIGEVLAREWSNLDLTRGAAKLVRMKTTEEEYRQVPTEGIDLISALVRIEGCPFVFPGRDLRSHLTHARKPWNRIRNRAGLGDLAGLGAFRLHDLRHNVVSWDVSRGVPLEIAGKNVGHRSRRSTEVYAHFAPDSLKKAAGDRARAMRQALEGAAAATE
jgi:integrase